MLKRRKPRAAGISGSKTRVLLLLLFCAVSIFVSFFALPYYYEAQSLTETVCVAAQNISKGEVINAI